jgi:hypothetical protein
MCLTGLLIQQEKPTMNRIILFAALAIVMSTASMAVALDKAALVGNWELVKNAMDKDGKPCPFVGQNLQFTTNGKMISANMPMPFSYKVNPAKEEVEAAIAKNPELRGMDIMLATMGDGPIDWTKARIVYGVELKGNQFIMKVSGYTPALYKKKK